MTTRIAVALALACMACDAPAVAPEPYPMVRVEPFTEQRAQTACPKGYTVVWKEQCKDNARFSAALVQCKP